MNEPFRPIDRPQRKRPAEGILSLPDQPTIVFVTACTRDRSRWLACDDVRDQLVEVWRRAHAWVVGRYVLMPDHVHFFTAAADDEVKSENWMMYWKSQFTRKHACRKHRWQAGQWETRMRSEAQYEEKWLYVQNNPVRHGLVEKPEDWPHRGEVFEIRWR